MLVILAYCLQENIRSIRDICARQAKMDKSVLVGKNRKALRPLEIPYTEMINHKRALFVLLTMILGKTTRNTSTRGIFHRQMCTKTKNFGENDVTLVAVHYFSILCS